MSTPPYAGALIAIDRDDRDMWAFHRRLLEHGRRPTTTSPVVAQVSRTPRQAVLHRLLSSCHVVGFEPDDAQPVGELLANAGTSDVVDAHLVLVAERRRALVITSDTDDIARLSSALGSPVPYRRV